MAEGFKNLKFGARPPKDTPAIKFGDIYRPKAVLPPHPPVDHLARFSGWNMLGNDTYGDCVAVFAAGARRLITGALGDKEYYPTLEEVLELYKTQNPDFPNEDNGMIIQTMLEWWTKNSWAGTKLLAFARVDHTNLDEVRAATSILGTVGFGFTVQRHNEDEFSQGVPWTYVPSDSTAGAHAVLGGGHFDTIAKDSAFITWARETAFAESAEKNQVFEFWALVFPEHLGSKQFMENIDLAILKQAYEDLTHRPFPSPTPPPNPNPGCGVQQVADWVLPRNLQWWAR